MIPFTVQTNKLRSYMRLTNILGWIFMMIFLYATFAFVIFVSEEVAARWYYIHAAWIAAMLVLALIYVEWYIKKLVASLEYELDGDTLHLRQGVFTYRHKAIPMERVTDIQLTQGILMRWLGFWNVSVQTASVGAMGAEGVLLAVESPKHVRQTLLTARKGVQSAS